MRTVLVVDDDPLVLNLTADTLRDLGCEVHTVASGAEALAKVKANRTITVLITDVNMPGVGGYELAERVKRERDDVKIILISGAETEGNGLPLVRKPLMDRELVRVMKDIDAMC
jgi:CheY-like chemotaxis protein